MILFHLVVNIFLAICIYIKYFTVSCLSYQVQNSWIRFTDKIDRMVEEAFKLNTKWSLQELSRAINGDGKSSPNPLFRVKVVLEGNQVEFSPTLKVLAGIINSAAKEIVNCLSVFKRLPDLLTSVRSKKEVRMLYDMQLINLVFFVFLIKKLW